MKKLKTALCLLCAALLLLTSACSGGVADASSSPEPATPEELAYTVITVTINPTFRLYLDENDNVIDMVAENEDAESIIENIDFMGRSLADAVKDIVAVSADSGFLKEDAAVHVTVVTTVYDEAAAQTLVDSTVPAVEEAAQERDITVTTDLTFAEDVVFSAPTPSVTAAPTEEPHEEPSEENPGENPNENPDENPGESEQEHEHTEDNQESICTDCNGTGHCAFCDENGQITCENCKGKGTVPCTRDGCVNGKLRCNCGDGKCWNCKGSKVVTCDACGGTGKDESGDCPRCSGTGKMTCNSCGGSGICDSCNGTGYGRDDEQCVDGWCTCENCNGSGKESCPNCGGSGNCLTCNGTGKR